MDDLSNIFKHPENPGEEDLKKYISGKSSPEEQHALEEQMQDSAFVHDAVEGLQQFTRKPELDIFVSTLNKNLQQQLNSRKKEKEKRKIRDFSWIIIAVITILLLCILAFMVIRMQRDHESRLKTGNTITAMAHLPGSYSR